MKNTLLTVLFCLGFFGHTLLISLAQNEIPRTQKVGLVLSGGGAKGLMHLGVIRALEENQIPIDYITGTSIGAIVGGMYAAGYTVDQILETVKSEQFRYWSTGLIQNKYKYYYKQRYVDASLISMSFFVDKKGIRPVLPTGLVPSYQMELAFLDLFAKASSAAQNDFDRLMIPFRSVSFNSFNKKAYIGKNGDLGQAVRSSMTFPLLYKPAVLGDSLLFDGGIVNNFPWEIMERDFAPDLMIGSKCTGNTNAKDVNSQNLFGQIDLLMMAQTNYEMPQRNSILLDRELNEFGMLDFDRAEELVQIGYELAMSKMESIKFRVRDRIPEDHRNRLRQAFLEKQKPLNFKQVTVKGVRGEPAKYIRNTFRSAKDSTLSYEKFNYRYFSLVADKTLSEIIPTTVFNPHKNAYDLNLRVTLAPNVDVAIGGYFSSSNNLGFIDIQHTYFGTTVTRTNMNAYLGKAYNSFKLGNRYDFYFSNKSIAAFIDGNILTNKYDYYLGSPELYLRTARPTSVINSTNGIRIDLGFPLSPNSFIKLVGGSCYQIANYYQSPDYTSQDASERSKLFWTGANLTYERNSLNHRSHPTSGSFYQFVAGVKYGNHMHRLGTSWPNPPTVLETGKDIVVGKPRWTWSRLQFEEYIPIGDNFSLGIRADAALTNKGVLFDYYSTLLQLPAFTPNSFTKSLLMEDFRGAGHFAGGLVPVYHHSSGIQVRAEVYIYKHIYELHKALDYTAYYGNFLDNKINWMSFASLAYNTKFGPISFTVSNFDWRKSKTYATLSFGYLIFNKECFD